MQLSPRMVDVVTKLKDGWEMGHDHGPFPRAWIQKNGLGRGGDSEDVHLNTFNALYERGMLEPDGEGPGLSTRYRLRVYGDDLKAAARRVIDIAEQEKRTESDKALDLLLDSIKVLEEALGEID